MNNTTQMQMMARVIMHCSMRSLAVDSNTLTAIATQCEQFAAALDAAVPWSWFIFENSLTRLIISIHLSRLGSLLDVTILFIIFLTERLALLCARRTLLPTRQTRFNPGTIALAVVPINVVRNIGGFLPLLLTSSHLVFTHRTDGVAASFLPSSWMVVFQYRDHLRCRFGTYTPPVSQGRYTSPVIAITNAIDKRKGNHTSSCTYVRERRNDVRLHIIFHNSARTQFIVFQEARIITLTTPAVLFAIATMTGSTYGLTAWHSFSITLLAMLMAGSTIASLTTMTASDS